ncbi:MAG: thiamine pyrophosphate-dependent enzyme [Candidatus Heimdallarchaeota archaeon]
MENLKTNAEITWCPGCGNFAILTAVRKAILQIEEKGLKRENICISSGIGCHAKIFDYLNLSGIYSLHGRDIATVQGMKLANPDLKVITFSGDGNALGEGLAHTLFAAKRNQDMTLILHNNSVYALTTGQFTPLTEQGWKGPSTPKGSIEKPFNALSLIIQAGGTFVARTFAGEINHLTEIMIQAIEHKGFSFVEVLQPAVPYHSWNEYRDKIEFLDKEPESFEEALSMVNKKHVYTLGIFYKTQKPVFHEELYGDYNPVVNKINQKERHNKIMDLLKSM